MDELYSELQKNAFLKITTLDNMQELLDEFNSLDLDLRPYTIEIEGKKYFPLDLEVAGLIDVSENPVDAANGYGIVSNFTKNKITETTLAKKTPKIINMIYSLFGKPWIRRVKISKLPPNSNMLLHTHPYLKKHNNEVVIHIPLKTNSNVYAVVSKQGSMQDAIKHHFAVGDVYYLNTLYHHKFENYGDTDRYHLWINLVWRDAEFGVNNNFAEVIKQKLNEGIKI